MQGLPCAPKRPLCPKASRLLHVQDSHHRFSGSQLEGAIIRLSRIRGSGGGSSGLHGRAGFGVGSPDHLDWRETWRGEFRAGVPCGPGRGEWRRDSGQGAALGSGVGSYPGGPRPVGLPRAPSTVGHNVSPRLRGSSHCSNSEQLGQEQSGRASCSRWRLRS